MKIQTKEAVKYNLPSKVHDQETGVVVGEIISASWTNSFNTVEVNYRYVDSSGIVIHKSRFSASGDDIETLYDAIKESIPTGESYRLTEETKYYLAFIVEMANTFNIATSDIEVV